MTEIIDSIYRADEKMRTQIVQSIYWLPEKRRTIDAIFEENDVDIPLVFKELDKYKKYLQVDLNLTSIAVAENKAALKEGWRKLIQELVQSESLVNEKIDLIIWATENNDTKEVLEGSELEMVPSIEVSGNYCANIDVAISLANDLIAAKAYSNIVILTGNHVELENDRILGTYGILGDGVGALHLQSFRENAHFSIVHTAMYSCFIDKNLSFSKGYALTHFKGFSHVIEEALKYVKSEDLDRIIVHNASDFMVRQILPLKGIDTAKIFSANFGLHGHLDTVDHILNLSTLPKDDRIVLILGIGVNGSYCSTLLKR